MKKISLLILSVLLLAVVILASVQIGRYLYQEKKEQDVFDDLAEIVKQTDIPSVSLERSSSPVSVTSPHTSPNTITDDASTMPTVSEKISDTDTVVVISEITEPQKEEPISPKRNLAPLFDENPDCIGWLSISGTVIDYPIMHTPDDPQKYLHKDFYGKYSSSGVPFLDARCEAASDNLIIYGHNMKNGTMFGTLKRYTDKSCLAEHPIIELETETSCVQYAVFAVVSVKKTDEWYSFITACTQEDYDRQIFYLREKAMLTTDVMPVFGQQILTLSTCYGSNKDGRLLVVAVKIS